MPTCSQLIGLSWERHLYFIVERIGILQVVEAVEFPEPDGTREKGVVERDPLVVGPHRNRVVTLREREVVGQFEDVLIILMPSTRVYGSKILKL